MDTTSSRSWVALPPEGRTHDELKRVVLQEQPREAVGLLTDDGRVIMLTNQAKHPEDTFEVHKGELLEYLSEEPNWRNLIFWHSHPGGGIGPSRTDMQQRIPFLQHLVVSIVNDDLVYTYY